MDKKAILVVDDEAPVTKALSDKLTREGFDVLVAKDGEQGLKMSLEKNPDLILLDIIMPRMDGMTMLAKLREDERGKTIPVIILTNLNADDAVTRGVVRDTPAYYLVKTDWTIDEVVRKVRERLGI